MSRTFGSVISEMVTRSLWRGGGAMRKISARRMIILNVLEKLDMIGKQNGFGSNIYFENEYL